MAMDASRDNSGLPPRKKGMPTWAKILMGCGILLVLAIGTCMGLAFVVGSGVGFAAWGFKKVSTLAQAQWPRYVETVKGLQDPASTKALYDANPGLHKRYSDADAFEQQVAEWRPAIQTPPDEMPSLTTGRVFSFQGRNTNMQFNGERHGGPNHLGATSGYRMDDGRFLVVAWEDGKIVEIQFERRDRN